LTRDALDKKRRKLVINLLGQQPFFGHVLACCKWSYETKCSDGRPLPVAGMIIRESLTILLNPETFFVESEYDQKYILLHEIIHFLFKHPWRAGKSGMGPEYENYAMDFATNSFLSDTCHMKPPEKLLLPERFKLERNKTFEWYLRHLPKEAISCPHCNGTGHNQGKGKGKGGGQGQQGKGGGQGDQDDDQQSGSGRCPHCGGSGVAGAPGHYWELEVSEAEADGLARRLFEGASKMAGTSPSGALRELYKVNAEVDWRDQFINYAQSSEQNEDWRFCKRHTSRRYGGPPGAKHEYMGEIHIFVDTSGSMSAKEIGACFSIIDKLKLMGYMIWVHEFDAGPAAKPYVYGNVPPKVHGGGGTMIRDSLKECKDEFPEVTQAIILSDGYIFDLSGAIPEGFTSALLVLTEDSNASLPDWVTILRMRVS
jgi:predicted metal-dependent peptidase